MNNLLLRLKLGGSTVALVAAASFAATAAMAQSDTIAAPPIESVVVTGTNIAGVSGAVGENVISLDAADMQVTSGNDLTDILRSNPALGNFNANAQGLHESDFFEVNIHGIGGSSSASTLEIIDGMRMPLGGTQHSEPDSGILPAIAVQRLDILSDGASSIYGADALAGVVNFITRESFDGVEFDNTMGYGRDYNTWNSQFMWGTHWDNGNMYIAYQHSYQSNIDLSTRLSNANFLPQGGLNEDSFNCSPAEIQPAGTSLIYPSATSTAPTSTAQANAPCFIPGDTDYVPKDTRDNLLIKATQQFGSRLTVQSTTLFAVRKDVSYSDGGTGLQSLVGGSTMTATAFETGPQANPFYVNPPGVTATQQTVYFNFTGLLPVGRSEDGDTDIYEHLRADYKLSSDWTITGEVVVTQDIASTLSYGIVCPTCALEGLNGTTNSSGNLTTPSIPGTNVIATTLPLTTANALDVWDPVGSNKTSAAELANISGTQTSSNNVDTIEQYVLSVNGTLFQVPAGPLKVAIGGQLFDNSLIEEAQGADGIGETSYGSAFNNYHFSRVVESAWVEANIPIISPSMNIPLVEKFDVDVAGRYDHYTILGPTSNPKFAFDWQVFQGLKLRGSYSTSFVAPQLDSIGDPSQGYNLGSSSAGGTSGVITFPTKLWPGTAGVLPGCAATAVTCQIGTSTLQGVSTLQGMGANAKPATGNGYTLGADYAPTFLPGMLINLTLWDTHEKGAVQTINNQADFFDVSTLNQYAAIYPTGATAAQIAADVANHPRLSSPLPTTVYYYINNEQRNVEDFQVKGIDAALNYDFDTSFGHFTIGDNVTYLLQYGIAYGYPTPSQYFNVLNSSGFTSQFDQIQLQSRTHVGWSIGNLALDVFMNYIGPYRNLSSTAANPASVPILTGGSIITGGDHVNSSETFDLHLAYNIPDGFLGGDQVFVNGQNIFDTKPPFYSSAMGYDDYAGSLIGRVMSLGLRARF